MFGKFLFCLSFVLILGCGFPLVLSQQDETPVDEATLQRGLEVYHSYYCGLCHASKAAGTEGIFGPSHDDLVTVAQERISSPDYTGTAQTVAAYLRESTLEPERYVVPGFELSRHRMPAFTHMSEEELDSLIYFLLHQQEVEMP